MDPLSDIIALLRPNAVVSKAITGRGRWGVRYAAYDAPGFTIILAGQCWVAFDGKEPLKLQRGDFVLLPAVPAFLLYSDPAVACVPREPQNVAVRHGDEAGEPDFVSLGGSFAIERVNAPLLLALLPDMIHIPVSGGRSTRLGRVIELIKEEFSVRLCGQGDDPAAVVGGDACRGLALAQH